MVAEIRTLGHGEVTARPSRNQVGSSSSGVFAHGGPRLRCLLGGGFLGLLIRNRQLIAAPIAIQRREHVRALVRKLLERDPLLVILVALVMDPQDPVVVRLAGRDLAKRDRAQPFREVELLVVARKRAGLAFDRDGWKGSFDDFPLLAVL